MGFSRAFRITIFAIGAASVFLVTLHLRDDRANGNVSSRVGIVEALVHEKTFRLDNTFLGSVSIDKSWIDGHFYSTKPPLLSVIAAGPYWVYHRLTGDSVRHRNGGAIYFLDIVFGLLPHALLLIFFARLIVLWTRDELAAVLTYVSVALGYLGLGYATSVSNHAPAASIALISFYYAFRIRQRRAAGPWEWIVCGALAGLLPAVDHPSFVLSAGIFVYLFRVNSQKAVTYFLPAALLLILIQLQVNLVATGSMVPVELRRRYFFYAGSYWLRPLGNDALNEPKLVYAFHFLLGHHGFISMTPVLALGGWAMVRQWRRRGPRAEEALCLGVPVITLLIFYLAYTSHYGGVCVGIRWLLPVMPLMMLFCANWIEDNRTRLKLAVFAALLAVGIANAADSLRGPWRDSTWTGLWSRWTSRG